MSSELADTRSKNQRLNYSYVRISVHVLSQSCRGGLGCVNAPLIEVFYTFFLGFIMKDWVVLVNLPHWLAGELGWDLADRGVKEAVLVKLPQWLAGELGGGWNLADEGIDWDVLMHLPHWLAGELGEILLVKVTDSVGEGMNMGLGVCQLSYSPEPTKFEP